MIVVRNEGAIVPALFNVGNKAFAADTDAWFRGRETGKLRDVGVQAIVLRNLTFFSRVCLKERKKGKKNNSATKLDFLFISHLHIYQISDNPCWLSSCSKI